jgi:hypothetical protein
MEITMTTINADPSPSESLSYGKFIGDFYARWTLDCLIDIARAVSADYVARPDYYKGADVPVHIADLWISYGYVKDYPNKQQRSALTAAVFGASDGYPADKGTTDTGNFRQMRDPLFKACIAYTRSSIADPPKGLKGDVISAMTYFPPWLRNFAGDSLNSSVEQLKSISELSYGILRSNTVSGVFGVSPPPQEGWPLETDDQRGAQLINAISNTLQLKDMGLSPDKATRLRNMAEEGSEALQAILLDDPTSDGNFESLVSNVYLWAKSIETYWSPGNPSK